MEKTIKVNPELFRIPVPKKSKRNKTAKRGQSIQKKHKKLEKSTNTLKKALIKKIQAHQERQRLHIEREQVRMKKENERLKEKLKKQEKPQEKPASSFEYLKKLQENVKERKEKRDKQKHNQETKQKEKSYLQDYLKKKEKIVPKPFASISLGKHTLHTQDTPNIQRNTPKNTPILPVQKHYQISLPPAKTTVLQPTSPIPESSTPVVLKEPPPYGILKGGSKPLFSSYRKTRKQHERLQTIQQRSQNHSLSQTHQPIHVQANNTPKVSIDSLDTTLSKQTPELERRRNKLRQIKALFKEAKNPINDEKTPSTNIPQQEDKSSHESSPTQSILDTSIGQPIDSQNSVSWKPRTQSQESFFPKSTPVVQDIHIPHIGNSRKRIRRTTRRKYQVGKLNTPRGTKVHLLVKNRKTRKKQLMENKQIQKTPILEVRKYLRERNLIRVGSQAPEHVLRQLYEASRFSGDVENKSSDVLLHNYMNTDGQTDGVLEPISQTEMNYDVETFLKEINGETSTTPGLGDTSALDAMLVNK